MKPFDAVIHHQHCRADDRLVTACRELLEEGYSHDDVAYAIGLAAGLASTQRSMQFALGLAAGSIVVSSYEEKDEEERG